MDATEKVLQNLSILSLVKQNDKLYTAADTFQLDPPVATRSLLRRWNGESRDNNVTRITEVITAAQTFVLNTLREDEHRDAIRKEQSVRKQARVVSALEEAQIGLRNLITTYGYDPSCQVRLTLLDQSIADFLASTRDQIQARTSPVLASIKTPANTIRDMMLPLPSSDATLPSASSSPSVQTPPFATSTVGVSSPAPTSDSTASQPVTLS